MESIQLQLDQQTIALARQVALFRQTTLEMLLQQVVEKLAMIKIVDDPLWGLFADEADFIDQMIESLMQTRQHQVLSRLQFKIR